MKRMVKEFLRETLSAEARKILKVAKERPRSILELADALNCSPRIVRKAIKELEEADAHIVVTPDTVASSSLPQVNPSAAVLKWSGERLRFAVVSDTHLGSKYEQTGPLRAFYAECQRRQIDTVLHAGDMHEGERIYHGQVYEILVHGADQQAEYAAATYPKVPGITTQFISGNHDDSFHKSAGVDVCGLLAQQRPDLHYLGPTGRFVDLECKARTTRRFRVHLLHPSGGAPYARTYRIQKIVEGYEGGSKPDLLGAGHLHFQAYTFVRNVHAFQLPCFQRQTPYLKAKGLEPVVGGYFFAVEFSKDGSVGRLEQELLTYYVPEDVRESAA